LTWKEFFKGMMVYLIIVMVIGLIMVGLWVFGVFTSGPKGSGDLRKDQNNAKTREAWSGIYNTDWQNLQADKANVTTLRQVYAGPMATQQDNANLIGAVLNCTSDVAKYNQDARNVLGQKWLPASLPASVNVNDYCTDPSVTAPVTGGTN
jgi:hypothetical protein